MPLDLFNTGVCGLRVDVSPQPPVCELVRGMEIHEAAKLLPRVFNLCRSAQSVAINMALGLEPPKEADLASEISGEHFMRLAITLPVRLGLDPVAVGQLPRNDMPKALFGLDLFPESPDAFDGYLKSGRGFAKVLREIRRLFQPGEAVADLPMAWDATVMTVDKLENSVAARRAEHPVLRHIEATFGRGPLWRTTARAIDLQSVVSGDLPTPRMIANGTAVVPAARGLYAVKARISDGRVAELTRITPTDHMLVADGLLEKSLATLPPSKHHLADLVVDILDPCVAVQVRGVAHA